MSRIEEIRETAEYEEWADPDPLGRNTVPVADAAWLLDRVEELEAQNEALHTALKASGERREQLERENERLREKQDQALVDFLIWLRGRRGIITCGYDYHAEEYFPINETHQRFVEEYRKGLVPPYSPTS